MLPATPPNSPCAILIEIHLQQHPSSLPASDMTYMSTTARAPPLPGILDMGERSQNTEEELRRAKPSASSFRGGAASSYRIHAASYILQTSSLSHLSHHLLPPSEYDLNNLSVLLLHPDIFPHQPTIRSPNHRAPQPASSLHL